MPGPEIIEVDPRKRLDDEEYVEAARKRLADRRAGPGSVLDFSKPAAALDSSRLTEDGAPSTSTAESSSEAVESIDDPRPNETIRSGL